MQSTLISIIVPYYNMREFVLVMQESVLKQTHQHWELIIVDDASSESCVDLIIQDPRIVYIKLGKNMGVAHARNIGIENAKGEILAFLDPDDYWSPQHLEANLTQLNITGATVCFNPSYLINGVSSQPYGIEDYESMDLFPEILLLYNSIPLSSTLVRKTQLRFSELPELQHVEDWEFWLQHIMRGCTFTKCTHITSFYRKHSNGATAQIAQMNRRRRALQVHLGASIIPQLLDLLAKSKAAPPPFRSIWWKLLHPIKTLRSIQIRQDLA